MDGISMNQKKKRELFLAGGLLLAALLLFCGQQFLAVQNSPAAVLVSVDGKETARFYLDQEVDTLIEGVQEGTNRLIIQDGAAFITEATCPDHLCISQGPISKSGQTIVCLPNRVVVTIQ
jgi:hypothetical protein